MKGCDDMAGYKKNGKGYLRKTFTVEGKKYVVYGKNLTELCEKEIKKKEEIKNRIDILYNPTIDEYYKMFTDIRRNEVSENTLRCQQYQYRNISDVEIPGLGRFGSMKIKQITRKDIEIARQILLKTGMTPENLNICFAHLNHVLNAAQIDETIPRNPCKALKKLKRSKEPVTKSKHRALSIEETASFFKAAKDKNSYLYNLFELMIRTGIRLGEASSLEGTDIDDKFIHIRKTISRDEMGGYYVSDDPKTISGIRDIPITESVLDIIKRQKELNNNIFGSDWSGLLFKSPECEILREYTVNREIKRVCDIAGVQKFTSHAFRDTFATRFIEQRPQDYKILSEILGHKDVSITLNLYTHVMSEHKVNAMNNVNIDIDL